MYEAQTYEAIMARLLAAVPDSMDKREGSFIWDALSPAALELAQAYINIDIAVNQSFINTAGGEFLSRGTAEMGIIRIPASKAIGEVTVTGTPDTLLEPGTLFSTSKGTQFQTIVGAVIEASGTATIPVQAVLAGLEGNVGPGTINNIPISVPGVTSVINAAATYGGEDEETDESLRTRYYDEIRQRAQDGNVAQYAKWAAEYPGIGRTKIFPLWNGVNTVKVSILDAANTVAAQALIDAFQAYLDPDMTGLGNGVAPIGAVVTVTTATAISINVAIEVALTAGYTEPIGIEEAITKHFADLAYNKTTVSYLGLAGKILDVPSVERLQSLLINSGTTDLSLGTEQIPDLGTFTCQVVTP